MDPKVDKDLRADPIVAQIHVGGAGAGTRLHLTRQPVRADVPDDNDDATTFLANHLHRLLQLPVARRQVAEHVGENRQGVHPDHCRLSGDRLALLQHQMLGIFGAVHIGFGNPVPAKHRRHRNFGDALHQMIVAAAIGDQVTDRPDFQPVLLGKQHQIIHAGHGAILVHDLADHPGRIETGQTRHIDRRLGMPGPDQNPAVPRNQRKHMARRDDMFRSLAGIDGHRDSPRPVCRRNAGCHPFCRFDGHRERGFVSRAILSAHQRQAQLLDPRPGHRQTDQTATIFRHEVDRIGGRHLGRNDQIALILPVFVIDQNEHPAVAGFLDNLLNRHQPGRLVLRKNEGFEFSQRVGGRVPVRCVEVAQRIGVKTGSPGQPRPRHAPVIDEGAEFGDQFCAHVERKSHQDVIFNYQFSHYSVLHPPKIACEHIDFEIHLIASL